MGARWQDVVARRGRLIAVAGGLGVCSYVVAWAVAGALWPGYSPVTQAISETFAIGAPRTGRALVSLGLVVSGTTAVALTWLLHDVLPRTGRRGRDLTGPVLATISGLFTVAVVAAPCTAGCPGAGVTLTDTLHSAIAGIGYLALVLAPLAFGWRVAQDMSRFAVFSVVVSVVALFGFALHTAGVGDPIRGGLQRGFNTMADAWYVVAAVVGFRRLPPLADEPLVPTGEPLGARVRP